MNSPCWRPDNPALGKQLAAANEPPSLPLQSSRIAALPSRHGQLASLEHHRSHRRLSGNDRSMLSDMMIRPGFPLRARVPKALNPIHTLNPPPPKKKKTKILTPHKHQALDLLLASLRRPSTNIPESWDSDLGTQRWKAPESSGN